MHHQGSRALLYLELYVDVHIMIESAMVLGHTVVQRSLLKAVVPV